MITQKQFLKAVEKVNRRKKITEKGIKELKQLFKNLNEFLKLNDNHTGYFTRQDFDIKIWRWSKYDNQYFLYEFRGKLGYYRGEIGIFSEYHDIIATEEDIGDICYIKYDEFIRALEEFINDIGENLKDFEKEVNILSKINEIFKSN